MVILSGKYETADLGQYFVQQNCWNTSEPQEIELTPTGFKVTHSDGSVPTNGGPKSYPSIVYGRHYDRKSPHTLLPVSLDTDFFTNMQVSVEWTPPTGESTWDSAFDIWFSAEPQLTGQNPVELMVWLGHQGPAQPVGTKVSELVLDGVEYDLWWGSLGWQVISLVARSQQLSLSFQPQDFVANIRQYMSVEMEWWLTSVQFGMEPWSGGTGYEVTKFEVESYATVGKPMLPEGWNYGKRPEGLQ